MKNLTILLLSLLIAFGTNLTSANADTSVNPNSSCVWKSWFKYPKNNASYGEGKAVYVRVDAQKYHDIQHMELYVNGKYIRKESKYPYEWCKGGGNSDTFLRHLKKGTYKLKCKIKTKCGSWHEIYCTIYIKSNDGGGHTGGGHCEYKAWFKYPQNGKYYNAGSDVYVNVDAQNRQNIKYTELYVNGKFVRKESRHPYEWAKGGGSSDGYLRNMKPGTYKLKCRVYDVCGKYKDHNCTIYVKGGGHNDGGHDQDQNERVCQYKSWYKYPKNNGTYRYGDDVYVRVDTEKISRHTGNATLCKRQIRSQRIKISLRMV